jgi:hypothetical protein
MVKICKICGKDAIFETGNYITAFNSNIEYCEYWVCETKGCKNYHWVTNGSPNSDMLNNFAEVQ